MKKEKEIIFFSKRSREKELSKRLSPLFLFFFCSFRSRGGPRNAHYFIGEMAAPHQTLKQLWKRAPKTANNGSQPGGEGIVAAVDDDVALSSQKKQKNVIDVELKKQPADTTTTAADADATVTVVAVVDPKVCE